MKAQDALARVIAASDELLAVHDSIKVVGLEADFPYPHNWNGYEVVDALDEAHYAAASAARLLAKVTIPAGVAPPEEQP